MTSFFDPDLNTLLIVTNMGFIVWVVQKIYMLELRIKEVNLHVQDQERELKRARKSRTMFSNEDQDEWF
ncbi:hypothetical protein [Sulfuracidifex metallicus]|uniref:hypothetical protein n=1 Tax=Sulfuracidifex metallicus TaxID=47303 RepID=UPI0022763720|nr:hypothetical protein [Sulfuracidifex metallicus]MCY0851045.1 hypothetical protein [Sulfuracidifex metallicus]